MNIFQQSGLAIVLGMLSISAFGQTAQGSLGATSTGAMKVEVEVKDQIQVTAIDTIDLTYNATDTGGLTGSTEFCVYVNGADEYTMKVGTAGGGAYKLTGAATGNSDEIIYTVKVAGAAAGNGTAGTLVAATWNTSSATYKGYDTRDCSSSDNAKIEISITDQELREATTDDYAQIVAVVVTPS
jgi:hypothetical protein